MRADDDDKGWVARLPAAGRAPWIIPRDLPAWQNLGAHLPAPQLDAGFADRPIIAHVGALAQRQPAAMAIGDGTRQYSFAQLYAASCHLGAALRGQGWPDGAVGVLLPNEPRYLVAMLGCLAAGRPCMLLAAESPPAVLARTIAAAGLAGVVATAALGAVLPPGTRWLDIDALPEPPPGAPPPPSLLDPGAPAVIVSTSGSTGEPKAVAHAQRAMLSNYASRIRVLRFGPHDLVAIAGQPATAGAVSHRFCALMAGAGLLMLDIPRIGLSGAVERIGAAGATVLHATPLLLKTLAAVPAATTAFARLRLAMAGGDELRRADLDALRACLPPGCRINFGLSLSESARVSSWCVPEDDAHDPARAAAGYLVDGIEVLLLDEDGTPVPPGEPGELVVRTPYAALGDWQAGALVTDRFPTDPADPRLRIVRTGDVVRIAGDGVVVVLGRRDRMVKLAGQRVEPAAIEAAMRAVPGVADAAVVALRDPGGARIAGFVVAASTAPPPDGAPDPLLKAVRAALRAALPAAMVPSLLRRIGAVPITRAGKRDERALVALAEAPAAPGTGA